MGAGGTDAGQRADQLAWGLEVNITRLGKLLAGTSGLFQLLMPYSFVDEIILLSIIAFLIFISSPPPNHKARNRQTCNDHTGEKSENFPRQT